MWRAKKKITICVFFIFLHVPLIIICCQQCMSVMLCTPNFEFSSPDCCTSHDPNVVLVIQPVHAFGIVPCHSRAHFLSVPPGWERTMTNTTHIRTLAGSGTDNHGDTGVICFCQ